MFIISGRCCSLLVTQYDMAPCSGLTCAYKLMARSACAALPAHTSAAISG